MIVVSIDSVMLDWLYMLMLCIMRLNIMYMLVCILVMLLSCFVVSVVGVELMFMIGYGNLVVFRCFVVCMVWLCFCLVIVVSVLGVLYL